MGSVEDEWLALGLYGRNLQGKRGGIQRGMERLRYVGRMGLIPMKSRTVKRG